MTPKINDLGFDNLNSCCKPLERPSKELVRQLDILAGAPPGGLPRLRDGA